MKKAISNLSAGLSDEVQSTKAEAFQRGGGRLKDGGKMNKQLVGIGAFPHAAFILMSFFLAVQPFFTGCSGTVPPASPIDTATPTPAPVPTQIDSRVSYITYYTKQGYFFSNESFYYNTAGRLTSHTLFDGSLFAYEYGISGEIVKISFYISGSLLRSCVPAYGTGGKITNTVIYDKSGLEIYTGEFFYNNAGCLVRKNLYLSGAIPYRYFLFTPEGSGLFTKADYFDASGGLVYRMTQFFNSDEVMTRRYFYNSSYINSPIYSEIFDTTEEAKKSVGHNYDGGVTLSFTEVYIYEPGAPNFDENQIEMLESFYIDTWNY